MGDEKKYEGRAHIYIFAARHRIVVSPILQSVAVIEAAGRVQLAMVEPFLLLPN